MNSQSSVSQDKRENLLLPNEIHHWHNTPDGKFRIGIKNISEIRMGVEGCNILIQTSSGVEWINFGSYKFMYADWDNPFLLSDDGNYLILNWMYFHVHGAINPVIVNLRKKEFCLFEPHRNLRVRKVSFGKEFPIVTCDETKWVDSKQQEFKNTKIPLSTQFKSIDVFYSLDPMSVETDVYTWKDKVLTITPLSEYKLKGLSGE